MIGYYRFQKGFYGLSEIPTRLEEKIERTLQYQTPISQGDMKATTKKNREKHRTKPSTIQEKLQETSKRAYKNNHTFTMQTTWLRHENNKKGKTNKKTEHNVALGSPTSPE